MLYERLLSIPADSQSVFLFGARGTGKTSWLKKQYPDALYLDLLDAETYRELQANPKRLANYIPPDYDGWIILDEVQKIPELLDEVHRLIESSHYRFILTGSSARRLKRKGINLLAGRALTYKMYPLTAVEQGGDFDLIKAVQFGELPATKQVHDPAHFLKSYAATFLREEVQQEGLTRNLGNFSRFLEVASFSQGAILNMSEIAREAAIKLNTVKNYFEILDDLLLSYRLPVFTKRAKRRLVSHPKFYYFDVGVFLSLRPRSIIDVTSEINGIALESLFYQELQAINEYLKLDYEIYYWRTQQGIEIDFIACGKKKLLAFEVKSKRTISKKDLKGLKAFKADYPEANCYVIYMGSRQEYHGDIIAIPMQEALQALPELLK